MTIETKPFRAKHEPRFREVEVALVRQKSSKDRVTGRVTPELKKTLRAFCCEHGFSESAVIEMALRAYFKGMGWR
jgi:hypothetical protein